MNRSEFLKALEAAQPGLTKKDDVEGGQCFVFIDGNVITYNDEVSVSYPLDAPEADRLAVPATPLLHFLRKAKGDEIKILRGGDDEDEELILRCGKAEAGIAILAEIPEHLESMTRPDKWKKIPDGMLEGMHLCQFSTGKDLSQPLMQNVNVSKEYVESGDVYRFTRYKMKGKAVPFMVPSTAVSHINKFAPIRYQVDESWVHFKNDQDAVLSSRLFYFNYMDLDQTFTLDDEGVNELLLPREKLKEMLTRAGLFAQEGEARDEVVTLTAEKGVLKVEVKQESIGWFREETRIKGKDKVTFDLPPAFLQEILLHTGRASYDGEKLLFDAGDFQHVMSVLVQV